MFPLPKFTNARLACAAILSCLDSANSCKSSNPPHEKIISLLFACFECGYKDKRKKKKQDEIECVKGRPVHVATGDTRNSISPQNFG